MYITFESDPVARDAQYLFDGIARETRAKVNLDPPRFFAFMMRDEEGVTHGGLNGLIYYQALYIDQLFVDQSFRGQGYGRKLIEKAESFAMDEGCHLAHLVTMSWEARTFYESCGYTLEFTRKGYANDHLCYGLIKRF